MRSNEVIYAPETLMNENPHIQKIPLSQRSLGYVFMTRYRLQGKICYDGEFELRHENENALFHFSVNNISRDRCDVKIFMDGKMTFCLVNAQLGFLSIEDGKLFSIDRLDKKLRSERHDLLLKVFFVFLCRMNPERSGHLLSYAITDSDLIEDLEDATHTGYKDIVHELNMMLG